MEVEGNDRRFVQKPPSGLSADDYNAIGTRIGEDVLRRRLTEEALHAAGASHQDGILSWISRYIDPDILVGNAVRITGCYDKGYRNFMDVRVLEVDLPHPRLPSALNGFRILQLSDLHLDLAPALTKVIAQKLRGLEYDLAVITGDFRNTTYADHAPSVQEMLELLPAFKKPAYAILGNHDFIEIVPPLERAGLRFLLNESVIISHQSAELYLAGIDDPHFYQTHDLERVRKQIPTGAFSILLSHSPEVYAEAATAGFDAMLNGHTHGGQFCLPGGTPILRACRVPARMLCGVWAHRGMRGYTSPGTGACGVPLRFFCQPEITLHILRKDSAQE